MKVKSKARLLGCFGGGGTRSPTIVDEDQRARELAELAARVDVSLENEKMACSLADLRGMVDDMKRAYEELEQLLPKIFLHLSRWQRVKDALRRPGTAKSTPAIGRVVTVK